MFIDDTHNILLCKYVDIICAYIKLTAYVKVKMNA